MSLSCTSKEIAFVLHIYTSYMQPLEYLSADNQNIASR
jgi:hypothetical protein